MLVAMAADRYPQPSSPALELWQTEWCPASHRVRQRLTELGLPFIARQVPVEREQRTDLEAATGQDSIPALTAGGAIVLGEGPIIAYLDAHFSEPPEGAAQREKAAKAKRKELEEACPKLTLATR